MAGKGEGGGMGDATVTTAPTGSLRRLAPTFALVAMLWSASSWGYYALADGLDLSNGYDEAPVLFAAYYLAWAGAALALLRGAFPDRLTRANAAAQTRALAPILLAYGAFVTFVLPLLPDVSMLRAPRDPPEFMFASAWYYLPKSADILFQQVLIAAMVRRCDAARLRLRAISLLMALLFGGFHLTLALDGFTPLYVARFTLAAALFGVVVPRLYLRTRHGFRWAYGLHWGWYALDATITHLVLAVPPWAM
ncbi:hypothetical protein JQC91_08540 [Jannaschia sp. Os4]|uniref:hypothetical protein n=1 Tax=Jannaschia sp. Os4 TaxID=2807617 RepID=UPI00193946EF|nr:hypothetical protein [Jannaschia sp. Os4]MBM2576353.1 hypothetical protein [Jannaschia sp. Os4]